MASSLSRLEGLVARASRDLQDAGVRRWALAGGIAVGVRCEPRFTRDVDVVVDVTGDREAERIVHSLQGAGYRPLLVLDHDSGRMASVRLVAPGEPDTGVLLDLLFATAGVEPEVAQAATSVEVFPGVSVPVALRGDLIAMKVLSRDDRRRPRDLGDLLALLQVATPEDVSRARDLVRLITERGFTRGKDLLAELEALLPSGG